MDFLELQKFMHGKEGIISYMEHAVPYKVKIIEKNEKIYLHNQLAVVKSGYILERTNSLNKDIVDIDVPGDLLIGVNKNANKLVYTSYRKTKLIIFDIEELFSFLEEKELLSNFLFYLCECLDKKVTFLSLVSRSKPEDGSYVKNWDKKIRINSFYFFF